MLVAPAPMADAPGAKAMLDRKGFSRLVDAIEVLAEWGFAHGAADCTYVGYDTQAILYPLWVLDQFRRQAQTEAMRMSLRDARKKAGLSQEALGVLADSGRSTIVKLERGDLPMTEGWAKRLAPHLGVRADQIWEGPQIPVIGYVGAGARVYAYDDFLNNGDTIDRPPMTQGDLLAVEVKGDSMLPLAEEGWHIVYAAEATVDEHAVINRVCVVQLDEDESMLVKRVIRGSKPYHYHLVSLNAPAIEDVRLRWAAVVRAIVPR
jgi:phage repressor protein C with HTH and peptisase S24 domain